jgi:diguanylate cyclase (GGDEF)-like protein
MNGEQVDENARLRRQLEVNQALIDADLELFSCLGRDEVIERVAKIVTGKFGWPDFAFLMRTVEHGRPSADPRVEKATGACQQDQVLSACCHVIPDGGPVRMKVFGGELLAIPIFVRGVLTGVIDFFSPSEGRLDEVLVEALSRLGAHTGAALGNAAVIARTESLLAVDPLTLLCNHGAMDKRLDVELARAQRQGQPLTVLLADLDHFQHYNATMGPSWGDEALRIVARTLRSAVRQVDEVGRFVSEEFCVLLPGTSERAGVVVGEKLRTAVQRLHIPGAGSQPLGSLTISVGLASVSDHVDAFTPFAKQQLLRMAELAAAEAKRRGKNRVVSASDMLHAELIPVPVERSRSRAARARAKPSPPGLLPGLTLGRPTPPASRHLSP